MDQLTTNIRSQQWLQMVRDQKASGMTVEAWCHDNNISKHAFYYRQHKLREQAGTMFSRFVEIQDPQQAIGIMYDKQIAVPEDDGEESTKNDQVYFGESIMEMFPPLLISKAVNDAKGKLNLKVNSNKLPSGVSKRLITYLLKMSTTTCVCGRELCEQEKEHIKKYLDLLPPRSYTSLYHDFTKTAAQWGNGYDKEKIESIIKRVIDNMGFASKCDSDIRELDEAEKKSPDIENLIVTRRRQAEERIEELDSIIIDKEKNLGKYKLYLEKQMKKFEELTAKTKENEKIISFFGSTISVRGARGACGRGARAAPLAGA